MKAIFITIILSLIFLTGSSSAVVISEYPVHESYKVDSLPGADIELSTAIAKGESEGEDEGESNNGEKEASGTFDILKEFVASHTDADQKVTVNVLEYYVGVWEEYWIPLTLTTSVYTKSNLSNRKTSDALQDVDGGLLNIMVGPAWKLSGVSDSIFPNMKLFRFRNANEGLFFHVKGGYKLAEGSSNNNTKSEMLHIAQVSTGLQLVLPLIEKSKYDKGRKDRDGNLTFRITGVGNYVGTSAYRAQFGTDADRFFLYIEGGASLFISDKIMISAGGTMYNTEDNLDRRVFFTVSLVR